MCKNHGKNANHLFRHCVLAWKLWSMIFHLFGVSWVMPHLVYKMFSCGIGQFGKRSNEGTWKVVPLCLMWCLWREQNAQCLRGKNWVWWSWNIYFWNSIWLDFTVSFVFCCGVPRISGFLEISLIQCTIVCNFYSLSFFFFSVFVLYSLYTACVLG